MAKCLQVQVKWVLKWAEKYAATAKKSWKVLCTDRRYCARVQEHSPPCVKLSLGAVAIFLNRYKLLGRAATSTYTQNQSWETEDH